MDRPSGHTTYRAKALWGGASLVALGGVLLGLAVTRVHGWGLASAELAFGGFGWGTLLDGSLGGAVTVFARRLAPLLQSGQAPELHRLTATLVAGGLVWVAGWGLIAVGIQGAAIVPAAPSEAVGAKLYPRLARDRDFHWGTLAAYGGGILFAELAMIFLQTLLAGSASGAGDAPASGFAPTVAFSIALMVGFAIAFAGGFLGASRARRMSTPESTIALFYFGAPIPLLLTLMPSVPALSLSVGYRLREVTYLAGLLGRPELGYWLVFAGLTLALFLGITSGFVATSSGRVDLRTGFELFVASRHVSVFRPKLLLGAFAVLIFGILPPLLIYAILTAAEAAVERTRIRSLGEADPLEASKALHALKLRAQTPTAMMTALSVGGVGVGVMALIIVLSVMSGFEIDLQSKILGTNAHGVVLKYAESMAEYPEVMKKIAQVKGVIGQTPFILNEVMISSEGNISGVMIKGIDTKTVGSVTDLPNYMISGKLDALERPAEIHRAFPGADEPKEGPGADDDPILEKPKGTLAVVLPGIVLGRELASSIKVVVGDRVNVVSPLGGELGPQGPMPKGRPFRVAGIFYSGMYEYDSKFVYIALEEAQKFFGVKGATGVEIKVDDVDDARRITRAIYDKLEGFPYRTKDWGEMKSYQCDP